MRINGEKPFLKGTPLKPHKKWGLNIEDKLKGPDSDNGSFSLSLTFNLQHSYDRSNRFSTGTGAAAPQAYEKRNVHPPASESTEKVKDRKELLEGSGTRDRPRNSSDLLQEHLDNRRR